MDIKNLMREAGILGAGGAGFPSYAKLAEGAEILLINAAECEPLLFTDYTILSNELESVVDGARLIADAFNIAEIIIGVKSHNAATLGWKDGDLLPCNVRVRVLDSVK